MSHIKCHSFRSMNQRPLPNFSSSASKVKSLVAKVSLPSSLGDKFKLPRRSTTVASSSSHSNKTHVVIDDDLNGISRAKMRSVQQMAVIVLTYIGSSTPFIFAQLWAVWGKPSKAVCKNLCSNCLEKVGKFGSHRTMTRTKYYKEMKEL